MPSKKQIAILGSTGSIGTQCLDVIAEHPEKFEVVFLMAGVNSKLLIEQAEKYGTKGVALGESNFTSDEKGRLTSQSIHYHEKGADIHDLMEHYFPELCIIAMPSLKGYKPFYESLKCGFAVALSNKESYLLLGDQVEKNLDNVFFPLDSEPLAIWQCLRGENLDEIDMVYLTASGGPLYKTRKSPDEIKKSDVLNHPVWQMGNKITVDSATLINKVFETYVIHKFFKIDYDKIKVVIHPEAHVHSMVRFKDGNVKMLASAPDMRHSISLVLNYPLKRLELKNSSFEFNQSWNFEELQPGDFPIYDTAMKYLTKGGAYPAALAVIDDYLVNSYLEGKIRYNEFEYKLRSCLERIKNPEAPTPDDLPQFVKECEEICELQMA